MKRQKPKEYISKGLIGVAFTPETKPRKFPTYYLPSGRRIWVLFQDTNGDESSKRYCFWFDSRKQAREYRAYVLQNPQWASVSRPLPFVKELGWAEVNKILDFKSPDFAQCPFCHGVDFDRKGLLRHLRYVCRRNP